MHSNLTNLARGLALALAVAVLGGCATSKEKLLTHGDRTICLLYTSPSPRD